MKDFFKSSYKNLILHVVSFVVVWTLLDLAWARLITHEAFQYSVSKHLISPIVAGAFVTYILHITAKGKSK